MDGLRYSGNDCKHGSPFESVGDATLLTNPMSVRRIAGTNELTAIDSSFRCQLQEAGLEQATTLRWTAKTARIQGLINFGLGVGVASCQR
jgi:hypothetical protein